MINWTQAAAKVVNDGPSMVVLIDSFAGLAALYLIKLVLEIRDAVFGDKQGKGLIANLKRLSDAVFGDEETGVKGLVHTMAQHCKDEREFWDQIESGRESIADRAQVAVSESETRLRDEFNSLRNEVRAMAERKAVTREGSP